MKQASTAALRVLERREGRVVLRRPLAPELHLDSVLGQGPASRTGGVVPGLSECCDIRSATVLGVPRPLPFPGKPQAQKYLNALRRRGCSISEGPDDLLMIELPGGLAYLARSFTTLEGEAWTAICDAAGAVGVRIESAGHAEDSARALLELLDGHPSTA